MVTVEPPSEKGLHLGKWSNLVSALFVERPDLLDLMPDEFQLVTLPREEPELARYALGLVSKDANIPLVYALIDDVEITFLLPQGPVQTTLQAA